VRGTSRTEEGTALIEAEGLEGAVADPGRPATVLDLVGDVAVVFWLMGTAAGPVDAVEAVHGPRLERLLEHLVDTPVRGFVYENAGIVPAKVLEGGEQILLDASRRWRIPAALITTSPSAHKEWLREASEKTARLLS